MSGNWNNLVTAAKICFNDCSGSPCNHIGSMGLGIGWGTSALATQHYNFAGLKWRPEMQVLQRRLIMWRMMVWMCIAHLNQRAHFINGYWRFIQRTPYAGWQKFNNDPIEYIKFIASRGYAGTPNYAQKVINLLDEATAILGGSGQ